MTMGLFSTRLQGLLGKPHLEGVAKTDAGILRGSQVLLSAGPIFERKLSGT
jgi:hypothetical protein